MAASSTPPKKKSTSEDPPLGVDEDYTITRSKPIPPAATLEGYYPGEQQYYEYQQQPTFFESDLNRPYSWSPNSIASLQSDLVAAGLLSAKGFSLGVYDAATRSAFSGVLTYANRSGLTSIDEAVAVFLKQPRGGASSGRRPFHAELPHPDDIKAVVDATVPNIIGRTLNDQEKQAVIAAYNSVVTGAQRAAYNADEAGGTVTDAPRMDTFVAQQARALHPDEAVATDRATAAQNFLKALQSGPPQTAVF